MNISSLGLDLLLAWRYLRGSRGFVSVISWISLIAMVLGTGVLIVVLSVMNGFERELRLRILGVMPHLLLYRSDGNALEDWRDLLPAAERQPGVTAAAPWISGNGMAIGRRTQGIYLRGIDPQAEAQVSVIDDFLQEGSLDDLRAGEFGIILGDDLAADLAVYTGDSITLVVPRMSTSLAGIRPRVRRFEVVGIFALGAELDGQLGLLHLEDAAALLKLSGATALRLQVEDLFDVRALGPEVAERMQVSVGASLTPVDWTVSYGTLFAATQLERRMVALLLSLIILIAAFNILASLVMAVDTRQSEIAILRTMGATRTRILRIFLIQGALIGTAGIAIGTAIGLALAWQMESLAAGLDALVYEYSGQRLFDAYFVHYLPSEVQMQQVWFIAAVALLLSCLAAIFPALRAMRLRPAEVLRYQ